MPPKKLYHCANSLEAAEAIQRDGFLNTNPDEVDYAGIFAPLFPKDVRKNLRSLYAKAGEVENGYDVADRAAARAWNTYFKNGTVIWTALKPQIEYGEWCFEFTAPKGSKTVSVWGSKNEPYVNIWVPQKQIPPKYFRLLDPEEIDAFYEEGL